MTHDHEFTGTFAFDCRDFDLAQSLDRLGHAVSTAAHHRQTNQHRICWTTVEFDPPLAVALGPEYVIECAECHETWRESSEADAEAFADRHADLLGHRPEERREHAEVELDTESVAALVRQLTEWFDRGVPWPALVGVLEDHGYGREEIIRQLKRLQERGGVYEPRSRRYGWVE